MIKRTVYLPKYDNTKSEASCKAADLLRQRIIARLSQRFGGCSCYDVDGFYVMQDSGTLVNDKVWAIFTLTSDTEGEREFMDCVNIIKTSLNQESVLYTQEPINATFA